MIGRDFIDSLRGHVLGWPLSREQQDLLADAVEEADRSYRELIKFESWPMYDGWLDVRIVGTASDLGARIQAMNGALSYLERRGLIERKDGEPHLVRFTGEA